MCETPHPDASCLTVFSGLRAYALSRYKALGILVFLLSLGPDVVNLVCRSVAYMWPYGR